jgi:apyrase
MRTRHTRVRFIHFITFWMRRNGTSSSSMSGTMMGHRPSSSSSASGSQSQSHQSSVYKNNGTLSSRQQPHHAQIGGVRHAHRVNRARALTLAIGAPMLVFASLAMFSPAARASRAIGGIRADANANARAVEFESETPRGRVMETETTNIKPLTVGEPTKLEPTPIGLDTCGRVASPVVPMETAAPEKVEETTTTTTTMTMGAGTESKKYAVVIDAGSTGSRIHVFTFEPREGGALRLLKDDFQAIKPGLSSYKDDPTAAAASLKELLAVAMKAVPESAREKTSIELRATAGLRLLPGESAQNILEACSKLLGEYPFKFDDSSVSIMDGADEGAYQWLTMNYLLGNLADANGNGDVHTVAAVDLGGGSVQLAYQVVPEHVDSAPDGYVTKLKAMGNSFDVYTRSHLGHGLMAARAAILNVTSSSDSGSPCVHGGHDGEYAYAGKTYEAKAMASGSDHDLCHKAVVEALRVDAPCEKRDECSFNGAWGGTKGQGSKRVYLSSYLWDRAVNVGIVTDEEIDGRSSVSELKKHASEACSISLDEVATKYHGVEEKDAPFMCMDLTFAHALLSVGFKRHEWEDFTLVKQIEYESKPVEAAWPLGAALNSM